jgi:hypothetical protein
VSKFLNTWSAFAQIESIISSSKKKLCLITPYIKMPESLLERLIYKSNSGVDITIVCREQDLKSQERDALSKIRNLELRFLEKLHAKCFYNEENMVITSLNLYETSQGNREMGILLTSSDDSSTFDEAVREAEFIVQSAKQSNSIEHKFTKPKYIKQSLSEKPSATNQTVQKSKSVLAEIADFMFGEPTNSRGYCIRCHGLIDKNPDKPLCGSCFEIWRRVSNRNFTENYCHICGKPAKTSFAKPQCKTCYKKQ